MLTGAFADLLLNTLIVVLLSVTIAYCWVLNRRIKILQDGRGELAKLLKHFDESTKRASDSVINLQTTSKRIGDTIEKRIEKCNDLIDDLAYMIDKGEKVAGKLEASFAVNRAHTRVMEQEPKRPPQPIKISEPEVEEREELAEMPPLTKPMEAMRDKAVSSLEAVLGRAASRKVAPEPKTEAPRDNWKAPAWPVKTQEAAPAAREPGTRQRSQAEQELLDMIKFGIKG